MFVLLHPYTFVCCLVNTTSERGLTQEKTTHRVSSFKTSRDAIRQPQYISNCRILSNKTSSLFNSNDLFMSSPHLSFVSSNIHFIFSDCITFRSQCNNKI